MSLLSEIDSLKEQIEEAKKREEGMVEEPEEAVEEEAAPEPEEEAPKEEEKAPEQPEEKPEAPLDDAGYAKLRREKAAAQKLAEKEAAEKAELQRQLDELLRAPREEAEQPVIAPEISEILQEHRVSRAEREFVALEAQFKARTPDYDGVAAEYTKALADSIRIQNPRLTPVEVAERTKMQILQQAGELVRNGFDPIEEMYHTAKELGFTGKSFQQAAEQPKEESKPEPKPDMAKVAANRARSAGMAGGGGESRGQMTKQAAADLSPAEWAKLPADEKKRLLYG
jgi:hypothetical protein